MNRFRKAIEAAKAQKIQNRLNAKTRYDRLRSEGKCSDCEKPCEKSRCPDCALIRKLRMCA